MKNLKFIVSVALISLTSGVAQAQVQAESIPYENSAYEYTDIVRAKFIRPGDVSPAEYQALLDEADRVKAYQNQRRLQQAQAKLASIQQRQTPRVETQEYQADLYGARTSQASFRTAAAPIASSTQISNTHYVVRGDTLYNISKRNNISVADLKAANGMSDNTLSLGETLVVPVAGSATVKQATRATTRHVEPRYVAPATTVSNQSRVGQHKDFMHNVDAVSNGQFYRVLPEDTLYSISRSACVSLTDIMALNQINAPTSLEPGQSLSLPAGHCLR